MLSSYLLLVINDYVTAKFSVFCVNRKPLPPSIQAANELDRYFRSYRKSEMANIAAGAAELRDTETSVDKALTKLERFLTTLNNLAVEVLLAMYCHVTPSLLWHTRLDPKPNYEAPRRLA